jgi:hypothetical protein
VNAFTEKMRSPSEKRNRIIHDPWGLDTNGTPRQLQITASGRLVFELKAKDLEALKADYREIFACVSSFIDIRNAIAAELPSWPGIPPTERRPTIRVLDPQI